MIGTRHVHEMNIIFFFFFHSANRPVPHHHLNHVCLCIYLLKFIFQILDFPIIMICPFLTLPCPLSNLMHQQTLVKKPPIFSSLKFCILIGWAVLERQFSGTTHVHGTTEPPYLTIPFGYRNTDMAQQFFQPHDCICMVLAVVTEYWVVGSGCKVPIKVFTFCELYNIYTWTWS